MSMTISVPKAGEDFTVPPGMRVESIEIRATVKGVRQAAMMVHPEESTIEFDNVPDNVEFSPVFTNAHDGELVVVEVLAEPVTPVEEPPVVPAPEDLVIPPAVDPAPVVEVTPSADITPTIPPTIDIATE
jgi:hypothetical protein